jgi:hypothetical protein
LWVTADQRHNDDLGFLALEVVDSGKTNGFEKLLLLDHLLGTFGGLVAFFRSRIVFESFAFQLIYVSVTQENLKIAT